MTFHPRGQPKTVHKASTALLTAIMANGAAATDMQHSFKS